MTKNEFVNGFLDLTSWTVPYGTEQFYTEMIFSKLLKKLCNVTLKFDGKNFYYKQGKSKTLFCSHLDTACSLCERVNYTQINNFIYSDKSTILGADDKAGVMVLLSLIKANVPGTYYFFVGEECGRIGSEWAARNLKHTFTKFDRAIAFDRRGTGSIISHQLGERSCSDAFCSSLAFEYKKNGLFFTQDERGLYTDTAAFIDSIPECTNISVGFNHEHSHSEKIDINYAYDVAVASTKVDWENLKTNRVIELPKFSSKFFNIDEEFDPFLPTRKWNNRSKLIEDNMSELDLYKEYHKYLM